MAFPTMFVLLIISLFLSFLSDHLTIAKHISGFSLKLIHRDSPSSPLYPGELSVLETIHRLVDSSESRALHLELMATNSSSPIYHPDARPLVTRYGFQYLVPVKIGSPIPREQFVWLDTGSNLIWIQCQPCAPCFPQIHPTFDPSQSSSHKPFWCHDPVCQKLKGTCEDNKCKYEVKYGGHSVLRGILANETFTLPNGASTQTVNDVMMGCSTENANISVTFKGGETDGILGMDASPFSLVSQTSNASKRRFSYCLVKDGLTPPVLSSYLRFGDDIVLRPPPGIKVETAPFVEYIPFRYALSLLDISVGKNRIGSGFDLNNNNNTRNALGACELDTGAQISFLDTVVYEKVKGALLKGFQALKLKMVDPRRYNLDLCYELPIGFKGFPSITYHFHGGDLKIASDHAFLIDEPHRVFCLAIKPKNGQNILGAKQQRNIRFVFDLGRNAVSFYPEDCSKDLHM